MCELKVHVDTPRGKERVAEDVVYAQVETEHVLLRDVLGATYRVSDSFISTIDIGKESLSLTQSSIVTPFLRFIEACQKVETTRNYTEVEESWSDLKAKGDEIARSFWKKYGRSS